MRVRSPLPAPAISPQQSAVFAVFYQAKAFAGCGNCAVSAGGKGLEEYRARLSHVTQEYDAFRKELTAQAGAAIAKEKAQAAAAEKEHNDALEDAHDATDRFIDSHRVRANSVCPDARTQAPGAGVSPEVPTGIVVDHADVRACGDLYSYAVSAYRWANGSEIEEP